MKKLRKFGREGWYVKRVERKLDLLGYMKDGWRGLVADRRDAIRRQRWARDAHENHVSQEYGCSWGNLPASPPKRVKRIQRDAKGVMRVAKVPYMIGIMRATMKGQWRRQWEFGPICINTD